MSNGAELIVTNKSIVHFHRRITHEFLLIEMGEFTGARYVEFDKRNTYRTIIKWISLYPIIAAAESIKANS